MQQVLDSHQPLVTALVHGGDGRVLGLGTGAALVHVANHDRIQHRGDTGCCALRVMNRHGRVGIPEHAGAWHQVLLEIVGMEFDQARHQPVTSPILCSGHAGVAAIDAADHAIFDQHGADKAFFSGHNGGVADDQ